MLVIESLRKDSKTKYKNWAGKSNPSIYFPLPAQIPNSFRRASRSRST